MVDTQAADDVLCAGVERESVEIVGEAEEDMAESSTAPKRKKRRLFGPPAVETKKAKNVAKTQSKLAWEGKEGKGKKVARYSFKTRDGRTAESAINVDDL